MKKKELKLKASEAYRQDVGKHRIRLDSQSFKALNLEPGDIVEVEGKQKTAAIVLRLRPEDEGIDIARVDQW